MVPQDGVDAGQQVSAEVKGACGGRLQTLGGMFAAQAH